MYFTLKYVAGYRPFSWYKLPIRSSSYMSIHEAEVKAKNAIDAILCAPLPELELWRDRGKLEDKLFASGAYI